MNAEQNKQSSRRHLAMNTARWVLAAGLALLSVRLLGRTSAGRERACIDPRGLTGCRECREWTNCRLPRALSVKQVLH
ncbi:MAG: hypothetical protein L0Y36_06020 [Planctomycetales bacterium]|nr:hypothetical protein [Planctomycetales bacterium]